MAWSPVKTMDRDARQNLCMQKWINNNGHGCIEASTGFGKTRVAINTVKWIQQRHPDLDVIVVVPTTTLQEQWKEEMTSAGCLMHNIRILVINSVIKSMHTCDLLIADEAHRYSSETFSRMFSTIKYKMILCLTATFERLDGKHFLLAKYAPIIDKITIEECLLNGWVSKFKEYAVVIEPSDIDIYEGYTKVFNEHFEFFDRQFGLAMSMLGPKGYIASENYAREICTNSSMLPEIRKQIKAHAVGMSRAMQQRKKYIYSHPEKLRLAEEIISHRDGQKIVTFSASVAMAERFSDGLVYTGKDNKKTNRITIEEFKKMQSGVIHTCKLGEEGLDVPDLSVGIMLGVNSSKTKHVQSRGRIVRKCGDKEAEFFTLILKDTVEVEWWRKSSKSDSVEIIDEENLMKVLRGEPYEQYKEPLKQFVSRY